MHSEVSFEPGDILRRNTAATSARNDGSEDDMRM
jgi:hypothetical protein